MNACSLAAPYGSLHICLSYNWVATLGLNELSHVTAIVAVIPANSPCSKVVQCKLLTYNKSMSFWLKLRPGAVVIQNFIRKKKSQKARKILSPKSSPKIGRLSLIQALELQLWRETYKQVPFLLRRLRICHLNFASHSPKVRRTRL